MTETENKHLKNNLSTGVPIWKSGEWQVGAIKFYEKNREGVFDKTHFPDPGNQQSSIFHFPQRGANGIEINSGVKSNM